MRVKSYCIHVEDALGHNMTRRAGGRFQVITGHNEFNEPELSESLPQHKAAELVKKLYGKAKPRFARAK